MELKTLLNNKGWDESDLDFSNQTIGTEIRSSVGDRIKDLFYQYNKIIVGNLFFLLLFSSVWFIVPVWETLIPISIIATCYLYMIGSVIFNRWRYDKPDATLPLPDLICSMLKYNRQILKQLSDYQAIIVAACSMAGFMLGLLIQLGSLDIMLDNPVWIVSMFLFSALVYFVGKKWLISSLNRAFNPRYFKASKYLKEQLAELEMDEEPAE